MHRFVARFLAVSLAATLSACSPGINYGIGEGRITFDAQGLVVHAPGHPNAHVSSAGDLRIGSRRIATTPRQRELLRHFYVQAQNTMDSGLAMGKQGAAFGARAVGTAIRSLLHGDSDAAEQQLDAQSNEIQAAAGTLCEAVNALAATQRRVAAEVPAFAPYASANAGARCTLGRSHSGTTTSPVTTAMLSQPSHPDPTAVRQPTPAAHLTPGAPPDALLAIAWSHS